jgi:hypothetical protein
MKNNRLYRLVWIAWLSTFGILLSTSVHSADTVIKNPFNITQFKASKPNAALYKDYRKNWARVTGFELSSLHWNQFVAVFINQSADIYRKNHIEYLRTSQDDWDDDEEEETTKKGYTSYPVGTTIVKEGYTSHEGKPGAPLFLVLMKKHKAGYDAKYGNWEYMKFSTDGTTLLQGKSSDPQVMIECTNCHMNVAERDHVFGTFFTGTVAN